MESFFGVIHPTVERYLLYRIKLSELWLVHNLELHIEVFKKLEILPVLFQYIFSLMNFFVNNEENVQPN
jgi:ABC-type amino acid transport system permease subunit